MGDELSELDPAGDLSGKSLERLDRYLSEALGIPRAKARRLLGDGAVLVNGREVGRGSKSQPVGPGDRVQLRSTAGGEAMPAPEPDVPLHILARGTGWIAVDKAAGQAVHPYREDEQGTLLGALVARVPEMRGVGEGGLRSGVVHRLDVETSGVLLFALDQGSWERARRAFETGSVNKRYRALVSGRLEGAGELELDLFVARHRPARVRVAAPGSGKRSWRTALRWRVLESFADASLVEVSPKTGFLHQVRVSMAELGHPLLGDQRYGPADAGFGKPGRHALHAERLEVEALPGMRAVSPDPVDFRAALRSLRRGGWLGPG
jgi:23S rRNA pseudouridine1911/1915/1917 synthase